MKNMKKLASLLLALVMVFALATTALAVDETYTLKLTGTTASPTAGHTFTVYQIFTGDLYEGVLSNVKYGANYTPGSTTTNDPVPEADLKAITDARVFADSLVNGNLLEGTFGTLNEGNNWTLDNVPAGYYLIVDTTETLPEYDTRSSYIVQVVDDVTMAPKNSTSSFEKKVKDINDSEDTGIEDNAWQDSADHDIGDTVPYQIKASFTDLAEFDAYEVSFEDIMSKGLTYDENAVITMQYTVLKEDGTTATATKDVTTSFNGTETTYAGAGADDKYAGGTALTFTNGNIKALVASEGNLVSANFTVDYTCTLNAEAVIGETGNPNKARMIFDREPDSDGKGTTPWDVNIVFTFKTDVNKVDPELKPLAGAEFKLEKFIASETGSTTYKGVLGDWSTLTLVKNTEGTVFSFTGLDDGYYRISETKAPDGYNAIDPIYFTVTAEHDVLADDPKLTDLQATVVKDDGTAYTEEEIADGMIATFTVTKSTGELDTDIVNKAGTLLPETGGIGTTIFYIVGGVLVLAAIVLLVTKKRMNREG